MALRKFSPFTSCFPSATGALARRKHDYRLNLPAVHRLHRRFVSHAYNQLERVRYLRTSPCCSLAYSHWIWKVLLVKHGQLLPLEIRVKVRKCHLCDFEAPLLSTTKHNEDTTVTANANVACKDNSGTNKDATAGTKPKVMTASPEIAPVKATAKNNKASADPKPGDAILDGPKKLVDVARPSGDESTHKSAARKKAGSSFVATQASAGDVSTQSNTNDQGHAVDTSVLAANEASSGSAQKKNKPSKHRKKATSAEKVHAEAKGESSKSNSDVTVDMQHVPNRDAMNPSTSAKTTTTTEATTDGPGIEKIVTAQPLQSEAPTVGPAEATLMSGISLINSALDAASTSFQNRAGRQPEIKKYPRACSESRMIFDTSGRHSAMSRSKIVPSSAQRERSRIRQYIDGLGLPGITYDKYGVCIDPDAPEWVRGRIARRVQCIVWDLEAGRTPAPLDKSAELALEIKEKTYFGEKTWDTLYKIEDREPATPEEFLVLAAELLKFDEKLSEGLIPGAPMTFNDGTTDMQDSWEVGHKQAAQLHLLERMTKLTKQLKKLPGIGDVPRSAPLDNPESSAQASQYQTKAPENTKHSVSNREPYSHEPRQPSQYSYGPSQPQKGYRTRPCLQYAQGNCPYGDHCHFLHAYPHELQAAAGPSQRVPSNVMTGSSSSTSYSSATPAMMGSQNAHPRDWGHASRVPSYTSENTDGSTWAVEGSQGSASGSSGYFGSEESAQQKEQGQQKRKKKGGARRKNGKGKEKQTEEN